jgi:hypothetical protein
MKDARFELSRSGHFSGAEALADKGEMSTNVGADLVQKVEPPEGHLGYARSTPLARPNSHFLPHSRSKSQTNGQIGTVLIFGAMCSYRIP